MTDAPLVLVSIVSTNDAIHVANCLKCLAVGDYANFAVFINENGGAAGAAKMNDAFAGQDWIEAKEGSDLLEFRLKPGGQRVVIGIADRNLGYAGGTNAGLRQPYIVGWDAVWVLNPDTFPDKAALSALVARQAAGGYAMVGSRLVFTASDLVQTWGGLGWNRWRGTGKLLGFRESPSVRPSEHEVEASIDFVSGASMYVTRAYIDELGGMDEDFFVFCEDTEWCLRSRGRHRFGYAHDSLVRHIHGATSGSSQRRAQRSRFNVYLSERNKVMLARKMSKPSAPLFWLLYFAGLAEHLVLARSVKSFRTGFDGWRAGVAGERGPPYWMR